MVPRTAWYHCVVNNGAESLGTAAVLCSLPLSLSQDVLRENYKKVRRTTHCITACEKADRYAGRERSRGPRKEEKGRREEGGKEDGLKLNTII